jgi:hypothetical protein
MNNKINNAMNNEVIFNNYRDKYSCLRHQSYEETEKMFEIFIETHEKTYPNIKLIYRDIYKTISRAYMFSDHKNKGFKEQYQYLKHTSPHIWKHQENKETVDENHDTFVKVLYNDIFNDKSTHATHYNEKIIIEMMAIASNIAFFWHSD